MMSLSELGNYRKSTGAEKRMVLTLLDITAKHYGVNIETINNYKKTISINDLLASGEKDNIRKELKALERKMKIEKLKSKI